MPLSPRHLDVLRLYALGMTRAEIGVELIISRHTVMDHLRQACQILGAENSVHAVTICLARGYLCADGRRHVVDVYVPTPIIDTVEA